MHCPVCNSVLSPDNDLDIAISIHIIDCLVSRIESMNDYIYSLKELIPLHTQIAYLPKRILTFPDVESPFAWGYPSNPAAAGSASAPGGAPPRRRLI
jgi:hypothetical protein